MPIKKEEGRAVPEYSFDVIPYNEFEQDIEVRKCYIRFHDDYIQFEERYYCDIPNTDGDLLSGWKNVMKHHERILIKSKIVEIGKWYAFGKVKTWSAYVELPGANTFYLYFEQEKDATQMLSIIKEWYFNSKRSHEKNA